MYGGFVGGGGLRWNDIVEGTFTTYLTPIESLSSSVTLRYGLHLPSQTWSGTLHCSDEGSNFQAEGNYVTAMQYTKEEYGADNPLVFNAPDIWDPVPGEDLCKYRCDKVRRRHVIVEFETFTNGLDIEVGHVITLDDEIADRVKYPGQSASTNWSDHLFNVIQVQSSRTPGQLGRVYVRAKEVYSFP
jgi:hypothetical protein